MAKQQVLHGLTTEEVIARRAATGWNRLPEKEAEPFWKELAESVAEPLQLLLIAVGVLYAVFGEIRDALVILVVIVTVAFVESATEWRAGRAIRALGALAAPKALVRRDGGIAELPTADLVPGDVILLTAGSRVPADAQLLQTEGIAVDESLVTGESQPVMHGLKGEDELMAGSHVIRGTATAVVTRTGSSSTLGRIASLVAQAPEPRTPLQRQLGQLAKVLLVVAIAVSVLVPGIGVLAGQPLKDMVLTGLTLAFATIPEELPILVVVVLGLGALALARQGAIVRRLVAAETIGAVTVVCSDKTGTLTENRMSVERVIPAGEVFGGLTSEAARNHVLEIARLASEPPSIDDSRFVDPIDTAIWEALSSSSPGAEEIRRLGFDDRLRLASALTRSPGGWSLATKGAPESVLERTTSWPTADGIAPLDPSLRTESLHVATAAAEAGQRVLAVGSRQVAKPDASREELERELVFEGLLVLSDPVRPGVRQAVSELREAGVAVSMVTGDQPATALAIAHQIGIDGRSLSAAELAGMSDQSLAEVATGGAVFARTRPEDKLRIARVLAESGEVAAMTGDGVNDAPALKAAAIGVAMGRGGSDVAREAADLVLTDDNFTTLVQAVSQGRRLFENLRKAVRYYLAVKVALVTVSFAAAVAGLPLPFAPVQIVILELFMDLGASVAFVNLPAESDEMTRPPRNPNAPFLDRTMAVGIVAGGLTLAAATGAAYLIGLNSEGVAAGRALAMATWLVCHAVLGVIMGWERRPVTLRDLATNPAMVAWLVAAVLFAALLLTVGPVEVLLHAGKVDPRSAAVAVVIAVGAPVWLEAVKHWPRRRPAVVAAN